MIGACGISKLVQTDVIWAADARRVTKELRLPLIVAPMFLISGPDLVIAAGRAGVIGAFPAPNARTLEDMKTWLDRIDRELTAAGKAGMWAINLIMHASYDRFEAEFDLVCQHRPRLVITALGSPRRIVDRVHAYGGGVYADVISPDQAKKAIDAGADGLVLVAAGAGGHTGRYSPFAFVEEVRTFWDGPLVLGGAIGSARALRAARMLGADFGYMGTRFIAVRESLVSDDNRKMLVRASMEDIVTTAAVSGVPANWMKESLDRGGYTPEMIDAKGKLDFADIQGENKAWKHVWGAGHGVGHTRRIENVAGIVDALVAEDRALESGARKSRSHSLDFGCAHERFCDQSPALKDQRATMYRYQKRRAI
jgi:nitronate monooxygenase